MKKLLCLLMVVSMLGGCSKKTEEPVVESEPEVEEKVETTDALVEEVQEEEPAAEEPEVVYETIEGCMEQEYPISIKITIQDMEVMFAKDANYTCEDALEPGDMITLYYLGELENNPVVYKVEKN